MAMSDRAFRALATREPDVVVATLRAVIPAIVGRQPRALSADDLRPTRLDALAPPLDLDWAGLQEEDDLLHVESQGYRDARFLERLFRYHLWLVLQYPKRTVHTVALWLIDPPARDALHVIERGNVRVKVSSVIIPRVPAEALLEDPKSACFAAGADRGTWSVKELCTRVARVLRESAASWERRHMAAVAAATQGRYKEMVEAMAHENLEPVIIEDLVHIGEDLGYSKGPEAGHKEGHKEGRKEGRKEGHKEGLVKGQRDLLVALLAEQGVTLTDAQRQRLDACDDPAQLTAWARHVVRGDDPATWLA